MLSELRQWPGVSHRAVQLSATLKIRTIVSCNRQNTFESGQRAVTRPMFSNRIECRALPNSCAAPHWPKPNQSDRCATTETVPASSPAYYGTFGSSGCSAL